MTYEIELFFSVVERNNCSMTSNEKASLPAKQRTT